MECGLEKLSLFQCTFQQSASKGTMRQMKVRNAMWKQQNVCTQRRLVVGCLVTATLIWRWLYALKEYRKQVEMHTAEDGINHAVQSRMFFTLLERYFYSRSFVAAISHFFSFTSYVFLLCEERFIGGLTVARVFQPWVSLCRCQRDRRIEYLSNRAGRKIFTNWSGKRNPRSQ